MEVEDQEHSRLRRLGSKRVAGRCAPEYDTEHGRPEGARFDRWRCSHLPTPPNEHLSDGPLAFAVKPVERAGDERSEVGPGTREQHRLHERQQGR